MNVHVFGCPGCDVFWTVGDMWLDGDPAEECSACGSEIEHETVELSGVKA